MFLYITPQKTFALTYKEDESQSNLFERILKKSGISDDEKSKATLIYEFEGDRWSLDDDDDLQILSSRFPASSTPSATLHLQLPQAHAHFTNPPAYNGSNSPSISSPSSKLKNKIKSSTSNSSVKSTTGKSKTKSNTESNANSNSTPKPKESSNGNGNGSVTPIFESTSTKTQGGQTQSQAQSNLGIGSHSSGIIGSKSLGAPLNGTNTTTQEKPTNQNGRSVSTVSKAKSVMSTRSRKSKWGDDDAETLASIRKREFEEFHNNNGVRTVMGKVNGIPNIRMLLKSGYRHVYISREFALKNKIVPKSFGMGNSGYTGLKVIGNVDITVGSKTASHQAYISEENHFDVVLGRSWLERMAIKIDPLDPTSLTYMDSGEPIPCDVVVLKDEKGNVITIT